MTWIRIDADIANNPKLRDVPRKERLPLIGLLVCLVGWSRQYLTDGQIPARVLRDVAGRADACVTLALRNRMIHKAGHHCATCAQPLDSDGVVIHDFAKYQQTKDEVSADRAATRERVQSFRERARNAVTEGVTSEVGQASVTLQRSREEHLLRLVLQLTYQQKQLKTTSVENLRLTWARWREIAGSADLAIEADAWLDRCYTAGMPDDPAGAWLGWLRSARARAEARETLAEAGTPARRRGCDACAGGWLGEDDAGRPIPCSTCRPNVVRFRGGSS